MKKDMKQNLIIGGVILGLILLLLFLQTPAVPAVNNTSSGSGTSSGGGGGGGGAGDNNNGGWNWGNPFAGLGNWNPFGNIDWPDFGNMFGGGNAPADDGAPDNTGDADEKNWWELDFPVFTFPDLSGFFNNLWNVPADDSNTEVEVDSCEDSDLSHANQLYVKGTCDDKISAALRTDYCKTDTLLIEYSCGSAYKCASVEYDCADDNAVCVDGACVSNKACSDTDGSATAYYSKGTCDDHGAMVRTDYCKSGVLIEYGCNVLDKCDTIQKDCSANGGSCVDGACVDHINSCVDSDKTSIYADGKNYQTYGSCTESAERPNNDYCKTGDQLIENYCRTDSCQTEAISCSSVYGHDFVCIDGFCAKLV